MSMWEAGKRGRRYLTGRDAPCEAERAARECGLFSRDDEEECFASEDITCYNCRYRRWTSDSFECMRAEP